MIKKRLTTIIKWFFLVLMLLNGIFFLTNIYVIGNTEAIVQMHEDLAPNAGAVIANIKVLNVFFVGLLFIISGICIIRKRYKWALSGIIGSLLFFAMYIVQIILWHDTHPRLFIDLLIFGSISLTHGIVSFYFWRKRRDDSRRVE